MKVYKMVLVFIQTEMQIMHLTHLICISNYTLSVYILGVHQLQQPSGLYYHGTGIAVAGFVSVVTCVRIESLPFFAISYEAQPRRYSHQAATYISIK